MTSTYIDLIPVIVYYCALCYLCNYIKKNNQNTTITQPDNNNFFFLVGTIWTVLWITVTQYNITCLFNVTIIYKRLELFTVNNHLKIFKEDSWQNCNFRFLRECWNTVQVNYKSNVNVMERESWWFHSYPRPWEQNCPCFPGGRSILYPPCQSQRH